MPSKGDSFQPRELKSPGTSNSPEPFDLRRMVQAVERQRGQGQEQEQEQEQGEEPYTYPDPNTARQDMRSPYPPFYREADQSQPPQSYHQPLPDIQYQSPYSPFYGKADQSQPPQSYHQPP